MSTMTEREPGRLERFEITRVAVQHLHRALAGELGDTDDGGVQP